MISKITKRFDKRNRPMAFFNMDCLGGTTEVIVFSDCFDRYENQIVENNVVFVKGRQLISINFSDLKLLVIPLHRLIRSETSYLISLT